MWADGVGPRPIITLIDPAKPGGILPASELPAIGDPDQAGQATQGGMPEGEDAVSSRGWGFRGRV